ncbi:MAG: heavy-metal-associated domain-containing protein [Gemmatimonadetes bacterium]|nr:MAG: heavy-metal-associated domain-containing protein [Gemmatimonadota bacterium]
MTRRTLTVRGMTCEGCVKSVTRVLERVEGVNAVEVSLDEGSARITARDDVPTEVLIAAVEKAGFEAEARSA